MSTTHFDLIALGGGSGGLAVAKQAAQHGAKAAIIESDRLGGTCVNRGCVPKKVMWYAASLAHALDDAIGYGFAAQPSPLDWASLVAKREAYIQRINNSYTGMLERGGVTPIAGFGQLVDAHTLQVGEQRYTAKHIVLCTGGHPAVPDVPNAVLGDTSDDFFQWSTQPQKVAVIGAGYIAVEIAGLLRALGSEVHLVLRKDRPLRQIDQGITDVLVECMQQDGIHIHTHTSIQSLQRSADGRLHIETGDTPIAGFDKVVWAIGRSPSTTGLGLDAAGIHTNAHAYIPTDAYQTTNIPHIFAIGDITGQAQLTPVAIAAGRRLADRLYGGMTDRKLDETLIPTVIFSHPAIGTVGLNEAEAKAQYDDIQVYRARFNGMYYAPLEHKVPTAIQLITQGQQERVIGLHMIGQGVDEILQGFAVAMRMGATKRDFDDTIAIHPTTAEELVTLR